MKSSNNRCDPKIKQLIPGHNKKCDCSRSGFKLSGHIVNAFFGYHAHFDNDKQYTVCRNVYNNKFKNFVIPEEWKKEDKRRRLEENKRRREITVAAGASRKSRRLQCRNVENSAEESVILCDETGASSSSIYTRRSARIARLAPEFNGNSDDDSLDTQVENAQRKSLSVRSSPRVRTGGLSYHRSITGSPTDASESVVDSVSATAVSEVDAVDDGRIILDADTVETDSIDLTEESAGNNDVNCNNGLSLDTVTLAPGTLEALHDAGVEILDDLDADIYAARVLM